MLKTSTARGATRQTLLIEIADQHGMDCRRISDYGITVYIPVTRPDGQPEFERFDVWTIRQLKDALGY